MSNQTRIHQFQTNQNTVKKHIVHNLPNVIQKVSDHQLPSRIAGICYYYSPLPSSAPAIGTDKYITINYKLRVHKLQEKFCAFKLLSYLMKQWEDLATMLPCTQDAICINTEKSDNYNYHSWENILGLRDGANTWSIETEIVQIMGQSRHSNHPVLWFSICVDVGF